MYHFFGLSLDNADEFKIYLHKELFILIYNKVFTFEEVYNIPIPYRRMYLNMLSEVREKENEEIEKAKRKK